MEKYSLYFNFKTNVKNFSVALLLFFVFTNKVYSQSSVNYHVSAGTGFSLATAYGGAAIDMTSGTTSLIGAGADAKASVVTDIGFDFFLMSNRFTQFSVNDDGIVQLGGTVVTTNQYSINEGTTASPRIAAFNADLRTGATTGKVHYKVVGAAPNRILVVEFYNMQLFYTSVATAGTSVWQVRLYETSGLVEFVYGVMDVSSLVVATIGRSPSIGFYTGSATGSFVSYFYANSTYSTNAAYAANPAIVAIGNISNLHSTVDGSRKLVRFSPKGHVTHTTTPTIASPASLNFTGVTATGMTLNWTASSPTTGVIKYAIYKSTDNIIFNYVASVNLGTNTYAATGLVSSTLHYWKVYPLSEGALGNALTGQATTISASYCTPTTNRPANLYINSVAFVGTLSDPAVNNSTSSATGFQDFSGLTPAIQADGSVVNINATATGTNLARGAWKAWVDWNGDGDFTDTGELVYSNYGFVSPNTSFGFVIPAGQISGNYRVRIRINDYLYRGTEFLGSDYGSCDNFNSTNNNNGDFGETEDYVIKVIYNCPAQITAVNINATDGHRCGSGSVTLSATGNGVSYKWYTSMTGLAIAGETSGTYTTPNIASSTYYYVTAVGANGCETAYRTPVLARIDPVPAIAFTSNVASICGDQSPTMILTTSGDKYEETLLQEKFNTGLGSFSQETESGYNADANGYWINRASPFIPANPPYGNYKPAISSGYFGGNYALIITDINRSTSILNNLVTTTNKDNTGFINLKLDFDLFNYTSTPNVAQAYLRVEYSTNGGSSWSILSTINTNQGNPNIWSTQSIALPPAALNSTQFKIRFSAFSGTGPSGWYPTMAAVDNIRIYGDKPLTTALTWSGATNVLYDETCTSLLGGVASNSVCIKPSASQIESEQSWTINATASFNNGCASTKSITINNDSKTWNPATAVTDWATTNWKPDTDAPTADKCVIIKKPVVLGASTNGFAKNIKIETASGNN